MPETLVLGPTTCQSSSSGAEPGAADAVGERGDAGDAASDGGPLELPRDQRPRPALFRSGVVDGSAAALLSSLPPLCGRLRLRYSLSQAGALRSAPYSRRLAALVCWLSSPSAVCRILRTSWNMALASSRSLLSARSAIRSPRPIRALAATTTTKERKTDLKGRKENRVE